MIISGHLGLHPIPSCDRRLIFLGFGSNFGSVHKIFGMSKNCRRSSRRCTLVDFVCPFHPPCGHRVDIHLVCVSIVFTSCGHRQHRIFSPYYVNTMDTRSLPMVLGRLHDVARPSQCQHGATVLHFVTL